MNTTYREEQSFTVMAWIIAGMYLILSALILLLEVESSTERYIGYGIVSAVFIPLIWVSFTSKLKTELSSHQLKFSFRPLVKERIYNRSEIESIEFLNYGFVGGWGIRLMTRYGTVYNTWGKEGMLIKLKNGKKFVIGTRNPGTLKRFLKTSLPLGE